MTDTPETADARAREVLADQFADEPRHAGIRSHILNGLNDPTIPIGEAVDAMLAFAALQSPPVAGGSVGEDQLSAIYERALHDVVNPIGKIQRDAEASDCRLSGMAYSIANSLAFVQEVARDALIAGKAALAKPTPPASGSGEVVTVPDFLAELRRVNSERYEAWVTTTEPLMLCAHCGRVDSDAGAAGSTHCNAPFDAREHEFTKPHPYLTREVRSDAGIMFDALELGGEVGELLNVVKKLEREERGWRGSRAAPEDFADECADVLICLDKLARRRGVDLAAATVAKFNATSDKVGLPHRLAAAPEAATPSDRPTHRLLMDLEAALVLTAEHGGDKISVADFVRDRDEFKRVQAFFHENQYRSDLTPSAVGGVDRLREAAQFLSDRLDDLEWHDGALEGTLRDYMGHVDPAHDRLKAALTTGETSRDGETSNG